MNKVNLKFWKGWMFYTIKNKNGKVIKYYGKKM